jgi:hypothetical protein
MRRTRLSASGKTLGVLEAAGFTDWPYFWPVCESLEHSNTKWMHPVGCEPPALSNMAKRTGPFAEGGAATLAGDQLDSL